MAARGLVISRAIFAAVELGIADCLRDDSLSADEIAEATGTHAPSLYRLMRSMTGFGFFVEDADRRFSLTTLGEALQSDAPGHARSTVRISAGAYAWKAWGEFLHSIKTGETAMEKAFGQTLFDYLGTEPEQATMFNDAMIGFTTAEKPAAAYDFSDIRVLVDAGGNSIVMLQLLDRVRAGRNHSSRLRFSAFCTKFNFIPTYDAVNLNR